jgi:hypothetical protein
MLRWSSEETGRTLDITAVRDESVDPGIQAGRSLGALGRHGSRITAADATATQAVSDELGPQAAADAAAVAAAFEGLNRIVDGVGLPIGRGERRDLAPLIDALGLDAFPHASHGM